jgi:plasmid replication initiation protein
MTAKASTQLELFNASSGRDFVTFRDDIDIMSLPFFSLSKTPQHTSMVYERERAGKKAYIRVTAGEAGIASVWDGDILMYLRTVILDGMNRGEQPSNRVRFVVNDYLRATGRSNGGGDYDRVLAALKRLQNTTVFTNITTSDETIDQGFGWIQSFRFPRRKTASGADVMAACEIVLSDWFYSLVVTAGRAISVDPVYFSITGGIERKLFLIARRHVGNQSQWSVNMSTLYESIGVQMPARRFKFELAKIIERGTLPHYDVEMVAELAVVGGKAKKRREIKVVFRPKRS